MVIKVIRLVIFLTKNYRVRQVKRRGNWGVIKVSMENTREGKHKKMGT